MRTLFRRALGIFFLFCAGDVLAQNPVLPVPPRPADALDGDAFARKIAPMDLAARDCAIANEILAGNVPNFLRTFCPVTVTNVNVSDNLSGGDATAATVTNISTFFVAPDYLAVGSDTNYFFVPISPDTAQRIADKLDCTLPTRKMADAIYAAAQVKLSPSPIPPSAAMTTVPVFVQHNETIWAQRMALTNLYPLGALVAGHKKDVVISRRLAVATNNIAIYGWHRTNGVPIQPLYLGHAWWWVDYSQCIRLVSRTMLVNGQEKSVGEVLADPKLCGLISDEGVFSTNARYRTNFAWPDRINLPWPRGFSTKPSGPSPQPEPHDISHSDDSPSPRPSPAGRGGIVVRWSDTANDHDDSGGTEWTREIKTLDGVRIVIDAPPPESFSADKPVELVFYALPNGNTIEETIGRKLGQSSSSALPDNGDWHYDIQHIGAQTRWLRQVLTNETLVVAYLEADTKSWPAWRKTHFDSDRRIAQILGEVCGIFPSNRTEIVLTSHSGGGSLFFGYLNAVDEIPVNVRRIAFLDSDYAYDSALHAKKILNWLATSDTHRLCVLAYQDYLGLLNGKPFVSEAGGTWGRSWAMMGDLSRNSLVRASGLGNSKTALTPALSPRAVGTAATRGIIVRRLATTYDSVGSLRFSFTSETNSGLEIYSTTNRQVEFLLKENPDHKILHTVQVERNGFIQALLSGTDLEGSGYNYLGERVYTNWIE